MSGQKIIDGLKEAVKKTKGDFTTATLIADRNDPKVFRVESMDSDGGVEVSIFSGPNALDRAVCFAGSDYYESWADPDGLAGY